MKLNASFYLSTLLLLASPITASAVLCIDKLDSGFAPIDLKVKNPPKGVSQKNPFYLQNGKVVTETVTDKKGRTKSVAITSEEKISNKKEPYCEVEYTIYDTKPYSKIWGVGAVQNLRIISHAGETSLSPRPNSNWVAVHYDCKNVFTYEHLKKALDPIVEVPCNDWGELLNKALKPTPSCSPTPKK